MGRGTPDKMMHPQEMLDMVDLVYASAGLSRDSSPEEVVKRLGGDGFDTLTRFTKTVELLGDDRRGYRNSDGVVPTSDVDGSSEESDIAGDCVPDVDDADATKKRKHVQSRYVNKKYKAETEIALSRIFDIGKVPSVADPSIPPASPHYGPDVITMTGFGELGRWGNQILQYMFLKAYASLTGSAIQVPDWVGATLFGMEDSIVQRRFPAVVEASHMKANSTFTDEFLGYIRATNADQAVPELQPESLLQNGRSQELARNVDFWGWFQWPTQYYKPFEALLRSTFMPVPAVRHHLDAIIDDKLSQGGTRTVVGLHLRLGDYKNIAATSFGYCAPTSWYLEWLEKIWPTLDNPVLFIASDEVETVLRDFAAYNPVTSDMIGASLPEEFRGCGAGFFGDWYTLTQCDVLAISNSTFSFTASMLNQRGPGARFFRAHYSDKMVEFDPWNADPILHREMGGNSLSSMRNTLKVLYDTQGTRGVMKNVLYELPYYGIRSVIMRTVLKARASNAVQTAA